MSLWSLLVGFVVFGMAFGLGAGVVAAAVAAAVYKGIEAAFGDRIKERFARKPDLRVVIAHDGEFVKTLTSTVPPPWPNTPDVIVAHEIQRLREEADASESLARKAPLALFRGVDPFAIQPRAEDYDRAREKFAGEVDEYEHGLRAWLERYRDAADARARTFDLRLWIISAKSGAYAEDAVLSLELPVGAEVVDEWPTVSPPPEPPSYVAPRPRSISDFTRPSYAHLAMPSMASLVRSVSMPTFSRWQTGNEGRRVGMSVGNIHHDAKVELGERLLLRLPGRGSHAIPWTLRTKTGRRHCTGTIELVVPTPGGRQPFTRLRGIERYPDVPFVDEDGEVVREARTSDPPAEPAAASAAEELTGRLRDAYARREWLSLGLGGDADDADVAGPPEAPDDSHRDDDAA